MASGFYKGFKNGLFIELASLISFILGIYVAIKFSYIVRDFLIKNVSWSSKAIQITAFILTLFLVIIAIRLLAKVLTGVADFAFLGWANNIAGAIFATLKSILLAGILLSLFQKVNINNMLISKETQESSLLFDPCVKTSEVLLPVLTDWFENLKNKVTEEHVSDEKTTSTP